MATNLFAPLSEQTKKDILVEFKAGKMHMDSSKMVRPDKRKGLVQLKMSDGLPHFIWKDRTTGTVEDDLIIMPEDAVFRKVEEANGRIYVLDFKTSDLKRFFWIQEPKDDKDKENCENINKFILKPPQNSGGSSNPLMDLMGSGGIDQNQFYQLLAQSGLGRGARMGSSAASSSSASSTAASAPSPSTSAASTSTGRPAAAPQEQPKVQLEALRNILSNFTAAQQQEKGPSLKDVVNVEEIVKSGLFDNAEVVKKLSEYLPPGPVNAENIKDNVQSPQFKQAIALFNEALRSGELVTIMSSFGLDAKSIGPNATIEDFLLAIQKKAKEESEKEKEEKMDTSD